MQNLKPMQEDYEALCRNQGLFEYLNQENPEVLDRLVWMVARQAINQLCLRNSLEDLEAWVRGWSEKWAYPEGLSRPTYDLQVEAMLVDYSGEASS